MFGIFVSLTWLSQLTNHFITKIINNNINIIIIMSVDSEAGGGSSSSSRDWLFPSPSNGKQQRDWIYPSPSLSSSRLSKAPTRRFFSTHPSPPAALPVPTTTLNQNRYYPASAGIRHRINFPRRSSKEDVFVEKKTAVETPNAAKFLNANDADVYAAFKFKFSWLRIIVIAFPVAVSSL